MPKISMRYMPSPKTEHVFDYGNLAGGLNIFELDYRLKRNESPDMKNLVWKDGCLNSRNGQVWIDSADSRGEGHAAYEFLFHGAIFFHSGTSIYYIDPLSSVPTANKVYGPNVNMTKRGTFFLYDTKLYYKAPGVYVCITFIGPGMSFTAENVTGYVPVTYINCSPANGAGDAYQPENRISSDKTLWYNADGGDEYHLPVFATSIVEITVNGSETTAYSYDPSTGIVTFTDAPGTTTPPTNNTVRITYRLENSTAMNNIMDCPYAKTYGGTGALCVVMGGSLTQPNAYFWNGSNVAMDPTYFPMTQYQLAGDSSDPITGFGLQQSYLVIFKERSVGRTKLDTADVDGRLTIDMPYVPINAKIGCDLPWSIQLIDNNLVWCNREQGVHILKDSSAAYENNIACISHKINGSPTRKGLFDDVRNHDPEYTCSCDDTRKYWVVVNGHAWVWDYSLSDYKDPSWFLFTNIDARSFTTDDEEVYHVDSLGRLTHFRRVFADYGQPIEKVYQFSTQYFGTYDNLKNVNSIIISMRSDTNGTTSLTYITDYERRDDLTPMLVRHWRLWPRNLSYRSLEGVGFAEVFRRRPMCRRVKHYTMRLENNGVGEDLSVVTAQVFYNFQGKDRGRQII